MLKMFYPTQDCLVNEAVCRNKTFIISFLHLLSCMTGPLLLLLREIVLIHPHYKLTSWRPANLSSVFWDPHLCFLNHVSGHLSWDLTTVLTALSFFLLRVCTRGVVWWRDPSSFTQSQSRTYQLQGRANKSRPASPGTFYQVPPPCDLVTNKPRANSSLDPPSETFHLRETMSQSANWNKSLLK